MLVIERESGTMSHDPHIDDLLSPFSEEALRQALQEAFRRGQDAMRSEILATLQTNITLPSPAPAMDGDDESVRAPRGLARQVIQMILHEGGEMITQSIQDRAVELDRRLSPKTIYNELNREKGRLYRLHLGRWSLIPSFDDRSEVEKDLADLIG